MAESIWIEQVKKNYVGDGVATEALKQIDLTLNKGELTAIVGPSGSGKSTLLSLIGTLDAPTSGRIRFGDIDLQGLKGNRLADFRFHHLGFIFQQFYLLPALTVLENVLAPLIARKVSLDKRARAEELLQWVGLEKKKEALPSQLSGGEQQRVAIARALVNEPVWLLADEPTGNLDSSNGETVFELLRRFQQEKGCGVLLVTHDGKMAGRADRMIQMRDGCVVSDTRGDSG